MSKYKLYEQVGNYATKRLDTDEWGELEEYLEQEWQRLVSEGVYDGTEEAHELFMSNFSIK